MKEICAAALDENGFVMSYDEAYNLIKETYPNFMQITEDCRFSYAKVFVASCSVVR